METEQPKQEQNVGGGPQLSEEDKKDIRENKTLAILSYLSILCLIPLLMKKDSKFVKFHAKQGLVLLIGWIFVGVPFFGKVLSLILTIFSVIGIINVLGEKYAELPLVGELAKKINI
jgi:uncharacterized membrane protein